MKFLQILAIAALSLSVACTDQKVKTDNTSAVATPASSIKTERVTYELNGKPYESFAAYSGSAKDKKPVVMVIPEWWGLTDYAKKRAEQLAELGYFAMAVDYYGNGKAVENPKDAQALAAPFYSDAALSKATFEAAKQQLQKFPQADASKVAVIGYCFGGAQALNMARQDPSLSGAVSFHGNLMTGVKPNNDKVKILVCHGANDTFVPAKEMAAFKTEMDSAKIDYSVISYPDAMHSFTNPAATAIGEKYNLKVAYNKVADEKSWSDMKAFLKRAFGN